MDEPNKQSFREDPVAKAIAAGDAFFLRTVLRMDVYTRLTEFTKQYATAIGKYDYSVAILALLDFYDYQHQQINTQQLVASIDAVGHLLQEIRTEQEREAAMSQPAIAQSVMMSGRQEQVHQK